MWKTNIGFINERTVFVTNIAIDNTPPIVRFQEQSVEGESGKSEAILRLSEEVKTIDGWTNYGFSLRKVFSNNVTYPLTLVDLAGNSTEILVDIKNASAISLEYGTYDDYSKQTLVSGGKVSSIKTISTNSLCKTESIFIRTFGDLGKDLLEGCVYMHNSSENVFLSKCTYSNF